MTRESSVTLKDLDIKIENVVAMASLDQKLDLIAIMKVFKNVEYRPKKFPARASQPEPNEGTQDRAQVSPDNGPVNLPLKHLISQVEDARAQRVPKA